MITNNSYSIFTKYSQICQLATEEYVYYKILGWTLVDPTWGHCPECNYIHLLSDKFLIILLGRNVHWKILR